jgi:hypothetical protein
MHDKGIFHAQRNTLQADFINTQIKEALEKYEEWKEQR